MRDQRNHFGVRKIEPGHALFGTAVSDQRTDLNIRMGTDEAEDGRRTVSPASIAGVTDDTAVFERAHSRWRLGHDRRGDCDKG